MYEQVEHNSSSQVQNYWHEAAGIWFNCCMYARYVLRTYLLFAWLNPEVSFHILCVYSVLIWAKKRDQIHGGLFDVELVTVP